MGGRDWFQASVSAMGIPAVAGSDSGRDNHHPIAGSMSGSIALNTLPGHLLLRTVYQYKDPLWHQRGLFQWWDH